HTWAMTRCPHTHTAAEGNNHRDPQEPRYEPCDDEQASCTYTGSRSHSFAPPQAHAGRCLALSTAMGNVEHCANIPTMLILTAIHSGDSTTHRGLQQEPHHAGGCRCLGSDTPAAEETLRDEHLRA